MIRAVVLAAAFLSGAALMSLEMAGFRLLPPYFGDDIYVWGSLISVFLGGLALGAFLGGRLADRAPALWKLGVILAVAGAFPLAMPLYADAVMDWLSGKGAPLPWEKAGGDESAVNAQDHLQVYMPPDPRWPSLGCGVVLFGVPALLLGMTTPYSAKLLIHTMPHLGRGVGYISGISTAGAIVGTLGTAFYLLSWRGTRWLLVVNGLVLIALGLALALVHLATPRERRRSPATGG
jgi:MFS family permease